MYRALALRCDKATLELRRDLCRGDAAPMLARSRTQKVLEWGGEGPRQKHGPNNYINHINKKNWAAFVRPIFLHHHIGNAWG